MPSERVEGTLKTVQVISIIVGVVISIVSLNATREKDANARALEARKPFLELRQKLYLEALAAAGVLTNPQVHSETELQTARKRFRELYVAELSMVESMDVEAEMIKLATAIDPDLLKLTPEQDAAYKLAHALRDSFIRSWGLTLEGIDTQKKR